MFQYATNFSMMLHKREWQRQRQVHKHHNFTKESLVTNKNAMSGTTCCCVTKKVGQPQQIDDLEFFTT